MSPTEAPRRRSNDSTNAVCHEAQARPQGEAATYFDQTQSFDDHVPEGQTGSSNRHAPLDRAPDDRHPYGYTENAGEASETYTGTAPTISYQQTLPDPVLVPAVPAVGNYVPAPPTKEDVVHNGTDGLATGTGDEENQAPVPVAKYDGPCIKLAKRGTIRGFVALARKKSHVRDDTPARLELLRRADKFFNEGFIGRHARLNKEKTALFREEIERVEAKLAKL